MLDILVFTDAKAAESLSGSPGFQFIAHSPGATLTDESIVQDRLQHAVPASLPTVDWEQHPATCVYTYDDARLYLSRGSSTGATLGGRPGNQLTVTVMTSDPYSILPLRPAQLYSSTAWNFARPSNQDLPGWETPVDIDEDFDIPGLHSLVVDDPWAVQVLPAALTMLEQTQDERRTRLFIRHPDQALVMRWVALLTRFLDAESALAFEFRVFSDDPLRSNTHVVGIHPLLSPDLTVEVANSSGVNVIDLERRELSSVTPSESAIRYAKWFIAGDPYEALEAIEVGRRWSRHMNPDLAAAAAELAAMESTRGEVDPVTLRTSLAAITALAMARQTDELEAYGDELADLAASCPPTESADLLSMNDAMWAVSLMGDTELAQSLALASLEWTAARPGFASAWVSALRPAQEMAWHDENSRGHASVLLATTLNSAGPELLPKAFALAKSLNTGITGEQIAAPIASLVSLWLANPNLVAQSEDWVQSQSIIELVAQNLDASLTSGDRSSIQALAAGSWDFLAPTPWRADPEHPVSRWFAVRELRTAPNAHARMNIIDAVQGTLPSRAWRELLAVPAGPSPDEVAGWIKSHGDVDPELALEIKRILGDTSHFPAWRRTGGAKVLHEIGKLGPGIPVGLAGDVRSQTEIIALFTQGAADKNLVPNTALRTLVRKFSGNLNGLYSDWVSKAVLVSADVRAAVALAEGPGRRSVIITVQTELERDLRAATSTGMFIAVGLLNPELGPHWVDVAKAALSAVWDGKKTELTRERLLSTVQGRLSAADNARLDSYLESQAKGRFTRGVLRGTKSMFGNKDK